MKKVPLSFQVDMQMQNETPFLLYSFIIKNKIHMMFMFSIWTPVNFRNKALG
jgi:hypothetical protein